MGIHMRSYAIRFLRSLSAGGLALETLLFASFKPTLIPRTFVTQRVLSGACFAIGSGLAKDLL